MTISQQLLLLEEDDGEIIHFNSITEYNEWVSARRIDKYV